MNQSELKTIILEQLKSLTEDRNQHYKTIRHDLEIISARQTESETQLARLSELYKHFLPLIDSINNIVNSKPQ